MMIEEAIKHEEEVAKDKINRASLLWDTKEKARLEESAFEHRQLAGWLKELKAHREAWDKVLDEMMNVSIPGQDAEYVYENIYDIIKKYRPKEGDIE